MTVIVILNQRPEYIHSAEVSGIPVYLNHKTIKQTHQPQTLYCSLPSNFLCLETNVVLILWLLSSTKFSNSCLLCWLSLSSISDVQQVYPWGQTRRCSPEGNRDGEFYTHHCHRIQVLLFSKRLSQVFDQNLPPVIVGTLHHRRYQRGTDRTKCRRVIFVRSLLSCESERRFDTAAQTPECFFYTTLQSTATTATGPLYIIDIHKMKGSLWSIVSHVPLFLMGCEVKMFKLQQLGFKHQKPLQLNNYKCLTVIIIMIHGALDSWLFMNKVVLKPLFKD